MVGVFLLLVSLQKVQADVVYLKGGQRLEGEVAEKGASYEIRTDYGVLVVSKADVEKLVKSTKAIESEAGELHKKARSLYDEALNSRNDAKAVNSKLKAGVECLRQIVQMYSDARETYAGEKYAFLDEVPIKILQEMRLYRDKMTSEVATYPAQPIPKVAEKAQPVPINPEPPPPLSGDPKKPNRVSDVSALLGKANGGDVEAQYALGIHYVNNERNWPEALKWFLSAGERNHPLASDWAGRLYREGSGGIKQDYKEAIRWFQRATSLDCTYSQAHLGMMIFRGTGCPRSIDQADALCEKALPRLRAQADQGDPTAQVLLGGMYLEGLGLPPSKENALKYFQKAAEQGYLPAMLRLGNLYERGRGVERNLSEAIKWYQMAAEQGLALGQVTLGKMYEDFIPNNPNQDYSKAFYWFRKAASQGDAWGQYYAGHFLMYGKGTTVDQAEAVKMYQLALKTAGDLCRRQTVRGLGYAYEKGWGVKQDVKKAMELYRTAADLGDLAAQHNLGYLTETVLKNEKDAFKWYMMAARQGMAESQTNVGNFFRNGRGVKKDLEEAEKWLVMAAQQGQPQGIKSLEQVRTELEVQRSKKQ